MSVGSEPGLAPLEVVGRLARLRSLLAEPGADGEAVDGLLVTTPANIRWLTGFSGSAGLLLVTADRALLTTDGRYRTQSIEQLTEVGVDAQVEVAVGGVQTQREAVHRGAEGLADLGLEADHVTWSAQRAWVEALVPLPLVPTRGLVERLRMVKDPGEVDRMSRAAAIADEALAAVVPLLAAVGSSPGRGPRELTESGFAAALDHAMRERGAEDRAFETIVASGENSAKPHARPGGRAIRPGDPVVVDFGAVFEGYRSDMTRTFCVGGPPTGELAKVFEVVAESQRLGVARVEPGATAGSVDLTCRDDHRRLGVGRALRARHRARCGPGHPRGAIGRTGVYCYSRARHRGHRGTRRVPARDRRGPHRGHPGGDGTRQPIAHPVSEGSCCLMAVSTNDLRNGMTLDLPEGLFAVVEFQHVKPGKGGAFVRTKLKNSRTGAVIERTYRADEKLEQAIIDKREMQFLYRDGSDYVFMDTASYEQLQVNTGLLGDAPNYLKEGDDAVLQFFGSEIVGVDLPASVELAVADTEPGLQGDRVSGARKPATLETGLVLQVPLFVNPGEKIKVDTRTGEYLTRA